MSFVKFLRTSFLTEHLWWLLLMEYLHFLNLFTEILSKDAPFNQKYLRANQGTFAPKDSHEAIMNRSRLAISFCTRKQKLRRKNTKKLKFFVVIFCEKPERPFRNKKFRANCETLFSQTK